jgi:hypothetical protein
MTAIIGFCIKNGAFLAADSARTDMDSGKLWKESVKKILPLTDKLVIFTGGLGTIGHEARDTLIEATRNSEHNIAIILPKAIEIFESRYQKSLIDHPGHDIPLTCIIAGQDIDGSGFIVAISSTDNFTPLWIREPGRPYFSGSNTKIVVAEASQAIHSLAQVYPKLCLDLWATISVSAIQKQDPMVAFPLQKVLVTDSIYEVITSSESTFKSEKYFEVDFPML